MGNNHVILCNAEKKGPRFLAMEKRSMRMFSIGHTWATTGGITPRVLSAWYGRRELPGAVVRHQLPAWVLDYSFLGGGLVRVRSTTDGWKRRAANEAHLYRPGVCFWEDSSALHPAVSRSAYLTFTGGEHAGLDRLLSRSGYACFDDSSDRLSGPMKAIAETGQALKDSGLYRAQELFWRIVDLLLCSEPHPGGMRVMVKRERRFTGMPWIRRVDAYFAQHLHEAIHRPTLAAHLNMSVSSLAHYYRAATGIAPMTRLINLRIDHAKHLLLRGVPLKQIAQEAGFSDAFHLSKTFKHVEGISPRGFLHRAAGLAPPREKLVANRGKP